MPGSKPWRHHAAIVSGGFGANTPVLFNQLGLTAELLRAVDDMNCRMCQKTMCTA